MKFSLKIVTSSQIKIFFCFLFLVLINLTACKNQDNERIFPYVLKLKHKDLLNYNYKDSLAKYKNIDASRVINKANLYCFLSNLYSLNSDSLNAKLFLEQAINFNAPIVKEKYFKPIIDYLVMDRPGRRTIIPPFLKTNFNDFIWMNEEHGIVEPIKSNTALSNDDFLTISYLSILDQWYRVPESEMVAKAQVKNDLHCQKELDRLFEGRDLPNDERIRSTIYVILLHSDSCEWTKRWLLKYFNTFKSFPLMKENLSHFMWRSYCNEDPSIKQLIEDLLIEFE